MKHLARLRAATGRVNVFAVVERLLTLASLVLVAVTVGGELGQKLGLTGTLGTVVAWTIALVYDALWIGALRMSEVAIRQRSRTGMTVMLGLSAAAVAVSTTVLIKLGHAEIFAGVPVAAAAFMGLRLFAGHVLADAGTAQAIADQDAADRNARALAAAGARHLKSEATTDVVTETAEHLAEMARQIARAEVLTAAQVRIDKARAKAEEKLTKAGKEHGEAAAAFAARDLAVAVTRPAVTAGTGPAGSVTPALPTGTGDGETVTAPVTEPAARRSAATGGQPGVTAPGTQVSAGAAGRPSQPQHTSRDTEPDTVTGDAADTVTETVTDDAAGTVTDDRAVTLEEIAAVAGVPVPVPGERLSDAQLDIALRHLRYAARPPRSYRQAVAAFRDAGYVGGEERVRRAWGELMSQEDDADVVAEESDESEDGQEETEDDEEEAHPARP
ncbi:hypothetical protein [Streptomyces mangrovi]|uniref:hypothetical protein n=1 Tax=Streptomyces mangrovi TaxID=1206892 RepID=UPI00399D3E2B